MTPVNLSPSAKARLVRQQLKDIEALHIRLTTCPLGYYQQVSDELSKAKAGLNSLMNLPTKESRRKS